MGGATVARDDVLIVEDEATLRSMYAAWLSTDYRVRVAGDATTALEEFDRHVDVVLLDRRLPDADGDLILPTLRDRNPDCRIALVTAVEPDYDILEMDFDAYMTKPVRETELLELVDGLRSSREMQLAQRGEIII